MVSAHQTWAQNRSSPFIWMDADWILVVHSMLIWVGSLFLIYRLDPLVVHVLRHPQQYLRLAYECGLCPNSNACKFDMQLVVEHAF